MKSYSTHYDTLFDTSLSKNNDDDNTMYFAIERQITSRRVKRLHHSSTLRNWNSSLRFFEPVLKSFSADDLLLEGMFEEFVEGISLLLGETKLAQSTIENYSQVLHGRLLTFADVIERVRKDVKQAMRNIRKKQKLSVEQSPKITDELIARWLRDLDKYCLEEDSAPNLYKIACGTSKMAYKDDVSLGHLLLLRGFVWLTIATGARTGEIRSLKESDVGQETVTRNIYKMRIYSTEIESSLPPFIRSRIEPMIEWIQANKPDSEFLFCETNEKKGKGTICPGMLRELVKGSMKASGLPPTTPGGYYRLHDLRKVWARWIDENDGSLEAISAFLGHSSTQVTYNTYFHDEHKARLALEGQKLGLKKLKELMGSSEDVTDRLIKLRQLLANGESIYADNSFSLRHEVKPRLTTQRKWSPLPDLNWGHPGVC